MLDSRTIERDGFTVVVTKEIDEDASPADGDSYTAKDVQAYDRGDWGYVGITARAYREGVELGTASLWACEEGYMPDVVERVNAFDHTLGEHENDYDIPGDAIEEAKETLAKLMAMMPDKETA